MPKSLNPCSPFPASLVALFLSFLPGSVFTQDPAVVPERYADLFAPSDLPAPDVLAALELDVNAYFATAPEAEDDRSALEKKISASGETAKVPFRVLDAVVRRGRVYPPVEKSGVVGRTLRVSHGGAERPYALFIPPDYDPSKPTPLVISLHGTSGDGPTYLPVNQPECARRGWFCVAPSADANIGFAMTEPGTALVRDLPPLLMREFNIDPNRIYVEGMSMGAHSTWYIGVRYPDRWAGLLSRSGAPWLVPNFLDNLSHLPAYSLNGDADPLVDVKLARNGRDTLKKLGYAFEYREIAGRGHELFMEENGVAYDWLAKQSRDPYPKKVVLKTDELIHGRSYWCEIRDWKKKQPSNAHHRGRNKEIIETRVVNRIPAKITGTVAGQKITLVTENVAQARIFVSDALLNLDKTVEVIANGRSVWKKKVVRSIPRMLQEAYRRGEREMTFAGWIDVKIP